MKKITNFIVKYRNIFLLSFIILSLFSLYISNKVNINDNIMKYLPKSSETKIGNDIMEKDFEKSNKSELNVMFKDLSNKEKDKTLSKLESIKGVASVDYENNKKYNKKNHTLYKINVNDYVKSKTSKHVYDEVTKNFDVEAMSGSIYEEYNPVLQTFIVVLAICGALVILILLSQSYIEPFLYLIAIGIAVFINKGTNIIFPSVSFVTNSIVAILQLALSMDYSIMLSNRYRQEKEKNKNKKESMKNALYYSFKAISSSSVTTVVGLLALVFMSFTIGKDLGFVLAKGVLLSLVSIFCCLPALLLLFDNLIEKTKKRSLKLNLTKLGNYSYKTRFIQPFVIVGLFTAAFFLKGNVNILYTGHEQDKVGKVFPANNQIAIVYDNKYEDIIKDYCYELEKDEKVDSVLCYANTLGEKLSYDELIPKLKSLGQDVNINEELIKIVYYNYFAKDSSSKKMTINQFINFVNSNISNNKKLNGKIDNDTKDKLKLLSNFTDINKINQKRSAQEISELLSVDKNDVEKIIVLNNSKNTKVTLTIKEFINFILNDLKNESNYNSYFDKESISKLETLKTFTNKELISKKLKADDISNILSSDLNSTNKILLLYRVNQEPNTKLTFNEFSTYALNILNNKEYGVNINDEQISKLKLLNYLSDENKVNQKVDIASLKTILSNLNISMDNNLLKQLLIIYSGKNTSEKLDLNTFATILLTLKESNLYKPYFSEKIVNDLTTIKNLTESKNTNLSSENLYQMFAIPENIQIKINDIYGNSFNMTLVDFINTLLSNNDIKNELSNDLLEELVKAKTLMDASEYKFTNNELSELLNIDKNTTNLAYGYYLNQNDNLSNISLEELINFVYQNKDNEIFKSALNSNSTLFESAYIVIKNINNKYLYKDMANTIGVDKNSVKMIYGLYDYEHEETKATLVEFTDVIINNLDNDLLKGKLSQDKINNIKIINVVMKSTLKNKKYSSNDLSKIIGIDNKKTLLIYSIYDYKKLNNNKISLNMFINFVIKNVLTDEEYSSKFNDESKEKLNTIKDIMDSSLSKEKLSSAEIFTKLSKLSKDLNKTLIDLVYVYFESQNYYDESWKLTIEEFVKYVSNDIINDERIESFIDKDQKTAIKFAEVSLEKSKKMLVSKKYSRMVLNTSYDFENKESFNFIKKLNNEIGNKKGVYVVGNTSMAVEMSKSFNTELNRITLLTMIFIFIVVAFTFKDLLIPLILVLIIQTAVYITMSAITLTGANVYFLALIIVQAILMGATIDYAIVYTSYYKELRQTLGVKEAIINAYNKSIHTIICSSSILIIVTLIVSNFASAIAAKICETVSQGTFASTVLILLILPGILATFDKFIIRKKKN